MAIVYIIVVLLVVAACGLALVRAGLGPTWFDRAMALNAFGTKILLLIALYCFATGYPEYVDIALLYALINYLGTIALVNYFNRRGSGQGARKADNNA